MPKIEISPDYYSNHIEKIKWPYSIYHQPIEDQINKELIQQSHQSSQPIKALNLGCGLFNDYPQKKQMAQWSASDLDPRCIHALKKFTLIWIPLCVRRFLISLSPSMIL